MQVLEEFMSVSKDVHTQQIIKGKRTKRQRLPSPLRLAIMPSNNSCNEGTSYNDNNDNSGGIEFVKIESRDRSKEEKEEEEDMANCLILLAQGGHRQNETHVSNHHHHHHQINNKSSNFYLYQCKTCNRCFPSFQALGGHRASHTKPNKANCNNNVTQKKQAATTTSFVDDHYDPTMNTILSLQAFTAATPITTITTTKKSKVHECSICGAEFSSGQALGGHMRRHRTLVNTSTTTTTTTSMSLSIGSPKSHEAKKPRNGLKLDLNLPAPEVDQRDQSKFSFQPRENVIAFSNSSLVDCHY